jgi:hypothetical protein
MSGYGYSVWLVPNNWKYIQREFSIDFIPHITIATNLKFMSPRILTNKIFKVYNFSKGTVFPRLYNKDPLHAFGYNCVIEDLFTTHKPHMSLFYSPNEITYIDTFSKLKQPPTTLDCKLYFADTNSLNPCEWNVIN